MKGRDGARRRGGGGGCGAENCFIFVCFARSTPLVHLYRKFCMWVSIYSTLLLKVSNFNIASAVMQKGPTPIGCVKCHCVVLNVMPRSHYAITIMWKLGVHCLLPTTYVVRLKDFFSEMFVRLTMWGWGAGGISYPGPGPGGTGSEWYVLFWSCLEVGDPDQVTLPPSGFAS